MGNDISALQQDLILEQPLVDINLSACIHCTDSSLDNRARQQSLKTPIQRFAHHGLHQAYNVLVVHLVHSLTKSVMAITLHWSLSDCWHAQSFKEDYLQSELSMPNICHDSMHTLHPLVYDLCKSYLQTFLSVGFSIK